MSSYEVSPQLISKIERIIDHDFEAMSLLAEVSEDIRDPTVRADIIGDEYGHVRFFTLLLASVTTIPVKTKMNEEYSVNLEEDNI